ncbi:MAG TPA: HIT family protein [Polyangiaceae bacterium]|nr:HIT family protein [Polyangiaceae bacterium]
MAETIFDKIIRGEIPCHKLYEDERVFAFLDIAPLSFGHALVIPKESVKTLDLLSDESAAAIGRVLPRLCRALKRITGSSAFNVLENNESLAHQAVPHVHFHIIPKPDEKSGLGIVWPAGKLDPEKGAELAAQIVKELAT